MDCPFCSFLKCHVGQYLRIGFVCNCDTNDHIYRDGYITRCSFFENFIKLFDSPVNGQVIFTGCCDNIFEIYLFNNNASDLAEPAVADLKNITSIAEMVDQRRRVLKSLQGDLQEEETAHE